jgi:hypothetical protein
MSVSWEAVAVSQPPAAAFNVLWTGDAVPLLEQQNGFAKPNLFRLRLRYPGAGKIYHLTLFNPRRPQELLRLFIECCFTHLGQADFK